MSDNRKQSRRKESRKRLDRRVGDRRADGVPPAPDTPAREDTGKRIRHTDSHAAGAKPAPRSKRKRLLPK